MPIAAATPRDKVAEAINFSELELLDEAVAEGVNARVAVRTTVTDPGLLDEVVGKPFVPVGDDDVVADLDIDLEVPLVEEAAAIEPMAVVPKRLPG